jgi:hypothetical protein
MKEKFISIGFPKRIKKRAGQMEKFAVYLKWG